MTARRLAALALLTLVALAISGCSTTFFTDPFGPGNYCSAVRCGQ